MYTVELHNTNNHLNEIYQTVQMKFAFCKPEGTKVRQIHDFVLCRDFLNDALVASALKIKFNIYGFNFDGNEKKVPLDKTYLLISSPNKDKIENSLKLLNEIEKQTRTARTKIYPLNVSKAFGDLYLAVGSPRWVKSTVMISLYTLLWRLGNYVKFDGSLDTFFEGCSSKDGVDIGYLIGMKMATNNKNTSLTKTFKEIITRSTRIFAGYLSDEEEFKNLGNMYIHYNSGICTFIEATNNPTPNTKSKFLKKSVENFERARSKTTK